MVCSWSGGKDCCIALHRALAVDPLAPVLLLTMLTEDGKRSRSNGVALAVLRAQAAALGAELIAVPTTWERYEERFREGLARARERGARTVIFGDLEGGPHREWNERAALAAGLESSLPLWHEERAALIAELEAQGYAAFITAVDAGRLDETYLGRRLDARLADELAARGVDRCGELGEFHTVVAHAPRFRDALSLRFGRPTLQRGYWHVPVSLARSGAATAHR
ncbi:MAG TPA: hypothetical protein VF041_06090 [Gemmatimonadaceae bacterium]